MLAMPVLSSKGGAGAMTSQPVQAVIFAFCNDKGHLGTLCQKFTFQTRQEMTMHPDMDQFYKKQL